MTNDQEDLDSLLDEALNQFTPQPAATEKVKQTDDKAEETLNRLKQSDERVKEEISALDEQALMQEMMKQFGLSGNLDSNLEPEDTAAGSIVDQMVQSLMSREVLYDPIKDLCEAYPSYLKEHKSKLSSEEYSRFERQFQACIAIKQHFDTPDSKADISLLMNAMQECGSPPKELMQSMAPGMELDEEGMPKMEGLEEALSGEDCAMQ